MFLGNMNFFIIVFVILLFFVSCSKKEKLNLNDDYALIEAMMSARNKSDKGIGIDELEKSIEIYESKNEYGKVCLSDALIGYKLFADGDFDKLLGLEMIDAENFIYLEKYNIES